MPLLLLGGGLIIMGLAILFSAGVYDSFATSLKAGLEPSNYFWFSKQMTNLLAGGILGAIVLFLPLKFIRKNVRLIAIGTIVFQLLVFSPLGDDFNGARGWLVVAGSSLQPVEFFKIGWVIFLSARLVKKNNELRMFSGFIKFLILVGAGLAVFLLIPDLGSLLLLVAVSLMLYRYQGGKGRFVLLVLFLGGVLLTLSVRFLADRYTYIQERVEAFTNFDTSDKESASFQVYNALIAVGAGGFWGRGYGNGLQKFKKIPETYSDFIFAAAAEEIGFVGCMFLLSLYAAFAYTCIRRIPYVQDPFYKNVAIGLVGTIILQMFINIAVNIKIMPVTGLTLPFVSYGGSSLMANMIMLALLYKILYFHVARQDDGGRTQQRSYLRSHARRSANAPAK